MQSTSQSSGKSSENVKQNLGFYKRRRGVYEHIMDGTIDLLEDGIHDFLCLGANLVIGGDSSKPAGICFSSAPAIHAHCRRVSERTIQRCLEHLETINWIKTFRAPNQRGNYPVLICRATVHNLSGDEYRVNADATVDWRHPVYEPVGQLSPETSNSGGYKRGERREKRVEKKEGTAPQSGTLPLPLAVKPVIFLPLNTGEEHPVLPNEVEEWAGLFPAVDVEQALRSMRGWISAHPERRKTKHGITRFIVAWLSREQDKGGRQPASRTEPRTFAQIARDTTDNAAREILKHAGIAPRSFDQIRRDEGDAAARRILERAKEPRTFDQIRRDETDGAISRVLERAGIDPVTGKRREVPIIDVEGD